MTRTFRLNKSDRDGRLARLFKRAHDESRTLYYAARETRALYDLETREARRAALADSMRHATTRDYQYADDATPLDYDWRTR